MHGKCYNNEQLENIFRNGMNGAVSVTVGVDKMPQHHDVNFTVKF